MLTDRERLLRVFNQQPVDRIPVSPFIHVNYIKEFYQDQDVDWVARTPDVYRHFGFDLIHRNCTPAWDAYGPSGPNWSLETTTEADTGRDTTTTTVIQTPDGDIRCVEALRWTYEYDAESSATEYPIKTEADFELFVRHQPPPQPADVSDVLRARRVVGDEGVVAPWIQGAFNLVAFYYRKLDDLLMDALVNGDFYDRMMTHFVARYKSFIQQMIDAGADILSYAGNIANGKLISPAFYEEHILPYERDLVAFIQEQGVIVLHHKCGDAKNLLPLYPRVGMKAHESLTPPPYGDTILSEAVNIFGDSTTLLGNIDQVDLLRYGSPEELVASVRETLDVVRGRCPFILGTTDYFNENTPHAMVHVLADAGRRHGAL